MRKVKSIIKKLLGRPAGSLVTIDSVSKIPSGLCVIGWYKTSGFSRFEAQDGDGNPLTLTLTQSERADVVQAIGEPAVGFQLLINADQNAAVRLFYVTSAGEKSELPIDAIPVEPSQNILAATSSSGDISGSCDDVLVSKEHLFANGWFIDNVADTTLRLVTDKGDVVGEEYELLRYHRKDVVDAFGSAGATAGFMALFKLKGKVTGSTKLKLELDSNGGSDSIIVSNVIPVFKNRMLNLKRVLNHWNANNPAHLHRSDVVMPMVKAIFPKQLTASVKRYDYGQQPSTPRASVIIPLYGRYDFLRFQMSHFQRSGALKDCEILFVVDDPNIHQESVELANDMSILIEHHFSLLLLSQNVGYGKANNLGANVAKADNLILLNSDIIPKTAGWPDTLLTALNGADDIGVVGARLLFEDGSIQHDGMMPMSHTDYPGLYLNDHPNKGWPVSLSQHPAETAECELVTAACVAIKKSDFEAVGGFCPDYILGDFEDSDLCFKLIKLGKRNLICRQVELFHLERQSQNLVDSGRWKHNLTLLNAITFNQRWQNELASLVNQKESF